MSSVSFERRTGQNAALRVGLAQATADQGATQTEEVAQLVGQLAQQLIEVTEQAEAATDEAEAALAAAEAALAAAEAGGGGGTPAAIDDDETFLRTIHQGTLIPPNALALTTEYPEALASTKYASIVGTELVGVDVGSSPPARLPQLALGLPQDFGGLSHGVVSESAEVMLSASRLGATLRIAAATPTGQQIFVEPYAPEGQEETEFMYPTPAAVQNVLASPPYSASAIFTPYNSDQILYISEFSADAPPSVVPLDLGIPVSGDGKLRMTQAVNIADNDTLYPNVSVTTAWPNDPNLFGRVFVSFLNDSAPTPFFQPEGGILHIFDEWRSPVEQRSFDYLIPEYVKLVDPTLDAALAVNHPKATPRFFDALSPHPLLYLAAVYVPSVRCILIAPAAERLFYLVRYRSSAGLPSGEWLQVERYAIRLTVTNVLGEEWLDTPRKFAYAVYSADRQSVFCVPPAGGPIIEAWGGFFTGGSGEQLFENEVFGHVPSDSFVTTGAACHNETLFLVQRRQDAANVTRVLRIAAPIVDRGSY